MGLFNISTFCTADKKHYFFWDVVPNLFDSSLKFKVCGLLQLRGLAACANTFMQMCDDDNLVDIVHEFVGMAFKVLVQVNV